MKALRNHRDSLTRNYTWGLEQLRSNSVALLESTVSELSALPFDLTKR